MDTIAAIATSLAPAGIGIVRISGKNALDIINKIFIAKGNKKIRTHTMIYGDISMPESNKRIDEVLVCYFKAPKSYTKEDVVEINSHGNAVVLNQILELVLKKGARLAQARGIYKACIFKW